MSRIRWLHPSQWTDEDFVACSPAARLLLLGLRNEADDQGVFEWRPLQLKMRLLPGDTVDTAALLDELVDNRQIVRFEANGSSYGVCLVWGQKPRRPTSRYPAPPAGVKRHSEFSGEEIPDNDGITPDNDGSTPAKESGICKGRESGGEECAPAREASPPPEDLPEGWRQEAQRQRTAAQKPAADLGMQWQRFRNRHAEDPPDTLARWRGRWLNWALEAHAAAAANGADAADPPAPQSRARNPAAAWGRNEDWWRRFDPGQRLKAQAWAERGRWQPYWGEPPDSPDCRLEGELIAAAVAERARRIAVEPSMLLPVAGGAGAGAAQVEEAEPARRAAG